jgi:competence ComEA-like helix-hairpin-helix protein
MHDRRRFTLAWIGLAVLGAILAQLYRSAVDRQYTLEEAYQVDLNVADVEELCMLPGIGSKLAERIVRERTTRGAFVDGEDLCRRVDGIGPKLWEALQDWARFGHE